jgi:hypothetical protein
MEFLLILHKGLIPVKIQTNSRFGLCPKNSNSNSISNLEMSQKRTLFFTCCCITTKNLIIFRERELVYFKFQSC